MCVKKVSALAVAPTVRPKNIVTIYINEFCAVSTSFGTTPLSFNRLPNISIPISGAAVGKSPITIIIATIGNTIFSVFETGLNCSIFIALSSLVVKALIIGGCITGTSAM